MSTELRAQIGGDILAFAGSLGQSRPYRDGIHAGVGTTIRLARDPHTRPLLLLAVGLGTIAVACAGAYEATRDSAQPRARGAAVPHLVVGGR